MADSAPQVSAAPIQKILAAARFAAEKHATQKRKGAAGEPYLNHLIEVAELVANTSDILDAHLVMAALLHDTIEDTQTTREELEKRFGADVAELVAQVTDDKSLPQAERKRLQVVNAPHKPVRAQVIKLADKISNLRSILASPPAGWTLERKRAYFDWAKQVVDGLSSPDAALKAEFESIFARFEEVTRQTGSL